MKKKLSKLELNKFREMSENEMKSIVGGSNYDGGELSPKQKACSGSSAGASCSFKYNGNTYHGKCCAPAFGNGPRHCTDLNIKCY